MSNVKDYKLELTDFEQVALEIKYKERDKQIAKQMVNESIDIKVISKITGLTIEEVEKL